MGLDFSHGIAHWSYSGFMIFRKRIVMEYGIINDLEEDIYSEGVYKFLINEDIYPIIDHSDCEGILSIKEMKQVIPALNNIINKWKAEADPEKEYDIIQSEYLIKGMKEAIKKKENIRFI